MKKLSLIGMTLLVSCKSMEGGNSAPSGAAPAGLTPESTLAKAPAVGKGPVTPVLSPAGGTFDYKPWVVLVGKERSLVSPAGVKAKVPGAKEFSKIDFVRSCTQSPLAADPAVHSNLETFCVEVRQSGKLEIQADSGPVVSADFTINPHRALTVQTSGKGGDATKIPTTLTEINTVCQYSGTKRPRIIIEAADDALLGPQKHVYFTFGLKSLELGTTTYDAKNILDFSALVKSPKSVIPWADYGNQWSYSSAAKNAKCTVTLDAYKVAGAISGKINCTDAALNTQARPSEQVFGQTLSMQANFHCDEFVGINR